MAPVKALVFDLDDTLYPEAAYVRSGFQAVARFLRAEAGLDPEAVFLRLWTAHLRGDRGRLFDDLLAGHPEVTCGPARLVEVYRTHVPGLRLYPGMARFLDAAAARGLRLALISDGWLDAQVRKAAALDLPRWFDPVRFTDTWGRAYWKPHPRAFEEAERRLGLPPEALVYVANNPAKDFEAPRARGWRTVRVVHPGQVPCGPATVEADAVGRGAAGLQAILASWDAGWLVNTR